MQQLLNHSILKEVRKLKIQGLEKELKANLAGISKGEIFVCPFCNYSSRKNPKGSAKMFESAFKCFSCSIWRAL